MCGIFGYFNRLGESLPDSVLDAMGSAIQHRGPDDRGIVSAPGIALGNQRLSIIDVEGGHQPFESDDGKIVLVMNGEIFNYIELAKDLERLGHPCRTRSDTEVVLRLYESEGIGFLSKLNGMFAIAIFDARARALYLARDRIGVKPLFIYGDGQQFIFASEIKSILKAIASRPRLNPIALHHYLSFNYVPPPHTMYQGVEHIMPGHYLRISANGVQSFRWWNLSAVEPIHGREESDWIEEFNAILNDAVRLRLRSDVPFGAFLSGGVDSSSIVGCMARQLNEPVKTFCIGFEDPFYDESQFAKSAAELFGAQHVCEIVDPDLLDMWPMATYYCDQPHGDVSFLPTLRLSQLAVKNVKVVLTGDGGDELFAGYDKYRRFFGRPSVAELSDQQFQRDYFESISLFSPASKQALYGQSMKKQTEDVESFDVVRPYLAEISHQDRVNQALYLDMQLLLSGNNLVKPDRMGMAVSLEARTPFLDYRMMEFAFRMPGNLKLRNGETKYLYKKAVAPMIGKELAYRRKQMFTVPIGEWFRGSKSEYCVNNLPGKGSQSEILSHAAVRSIYDRHFTRQEDKTRELRALVAFSLWCALP